MDRTLLGTRLAANERRTGQYGNVRLASVPAIDMLFNQFDETNPQAQFGNIRAVKELRSAANQTGCNRTLSETYGGGGWDETLKISNG